MSSIFTNNNLIRYLDIIEHEKLLLGKLLQSHEIVIALRNSEY